jgi:hypothetical protein
MSLSTQLRWSFWSWSPVEAAPWSATASAGPPRRRARFPQLRRCSVPRLSSRALWRGRARASSPGAPGYRQRAKMERGPSLPPGTDDPFFKGSSTSSSARKAPLAPVRNISSPGSAPASSSTSEGSCSPISMWVGGRTRSSSGSLTRKSTAASSPAPIRRRFCDGALPARPACIDGWPDRQSRCAPGRRAGRCHRKSLWAGPDRDRRRHQRNRPLRRRNSHLRELRPDRRLDQSGQFRRPVGESEGRGRRDQHRHRGGRAGHRVRDPINMVKRVLDQLVDTGKVVRGWIGVSLQPLSPELAQSVGLDGAVVGSTIAGSPAAPRPACSRAT